MFYMHAYTHMHKRVCVLFFLGGEGGGEVRERGTECMAVVSLVVSLPLPIEY